MISKRIVAKMKEYRKKQGWDQFAFAQRLDLHEKTISRYERGATPVPLSVVEAFSRLSGIPVYKLVMEDGSTAEDEAKRHFLDDVWDAHLRYFSSASAPTSSPDVEELKLDDREDKSR